MAKPACRDHLLHERNMREAAALHAQLRRVLLSQHFCTAKALPFKAVPCSSILGTPVATRLKRALMAAHIDQVRACAKAALPVLQLSAQVLKRLLLSTAEPDLAPWSCLPRETMGRHQTAVQRHCSGALCMLRF